MPAIAGLGIRGLLWVATLVGIGSWFGGDTIENQTIIAQKWTVVDYIVAVVLLISLVWLLVFIVKKIKKNG